MSTINSFAKQPEDVAKTLRGFIDDHSPEVIQVRLHVLALPI